MANGLPRSQLREHFDTETRLRLVENDIDQADARIRLELVSIREEVKGLRRLWWGVIAAVGTMTTMLIVNLIGALAGLYGGS